MAKRFPFSKQDIILASSSPRRRYLLRLVRIPHRVAIPDVSEEVRPGEEPVEHVMRLSRQKALSVRDAFEKGLLLGADTIVVLDGQILGKPKDTAEAEVMLRRLAGRLHHVYTGLTLIDVGSGREAGGYERTQVKIRRMTTAEIKAYIDTGEPMDKAGSYGIQGYGAAIVESVSGCYFNVVGLPLVRLLFLMRELEQKMRR